MRGSHVRVVADDEWVAAATEAMLSPVGAALDARGRAVIALSGGSTPWPVYERFADAVERPEALTIVQVDERLAPDGSDERNDTGLRSSLGSLLETADYRPMRVDPLDVDTSLADLVEVAGDPIVLDLVVLGLGDDGHVASLVPHDPALHATEPGVAVSRPYRGRRRLTLTFPTLRAARARLVLVRGRTKASPLRQALAGESRVPASRLVGAGTVVVADPLAGGVVA